MQQPNTPISFRLTANEVALLEAHAREFGLRSPSLAARKIIVEHLSDQAESPIVARLRELAGELAEARADLSVATEALLVYSGKLKEEAAHEWVMQNLKPR